MRRLGVAVFVLLCAGLADAQIAWLGAGIGTAYEVNPPAWPDKTFYHSSDLVPSVLFALRLDEDTNLRFRFADLPFQVPLATSNGATQRSAARLQAATVGVDYFLDDPMGRLVFSGGIGAYTLNLKAGQSPPGVETTRFGWYVGVGEWFRLTRRTRVTLDVTLDRSDHTGNPTILTGNIGLAYGF
jgi:hypothetical protein